MYAFHVEQFVSNMNYKFYLHLAESSNEKTTTPGTTYNCDPGMSKNNPERNILNCNDHSNIVKSPLQHADRFDTIWLYMKKNLPTFSQQLFS